MSPRPATSGAVIRGQIVPDHSNSVYIDKK